MQTRAERNSGTEEYFFTASRRDCTANQAGIVHGQSVRISFVGDLMRANGLGNSSNIVYSRVARQIFGADISFANLESAVIDLEQHVTGPRTAITETEFESFRGHEGRQFSIFSTANNHIFDGGQPGLEAVHNLLDSKGIRYVGTNRFESQQGQGAVVEANGLKIGFVAATYDVNNTVSLRDREHLVNIVPFARAQERTDLSLLENQLAWCRSEGCNFVVASLHWGHEFEFFPRAYQVKLAHELAEAGFDAILGHHSHTIQPYEIYKTSESHRKVPIFYGLGNFLSWSRAPYRCLSLLGSITIQAESVDDGRRSFVSDINVVPVVQLEVPCGGKIGIELRKLDDLSGASCGSREKQIFEEVSGYADLALGKSWRRSVS